MIRSQCAQSVDWGSYLKGMKSRLMDRRRFLIASTVGGLAMLMPLSVVTAKNEDKKGWLILASVQDILFPSEPDAPGAKELNALSYLKWVLADEHLDKSERDFVIRGVNWLNDMALQSHDDNFHNLGRESQEKLIEQIAQSDAGENWLATLLLYLFEALLTDPVYGGNPEQIGWRWLGHQPGFPLANEQNRYKAGRA